MQICGGIVQAAPGWEKIRFAPCFEMDACEATIPSPRGTIRSAWQREGDRIAVRLDLPPGVEAEVVLPGVSPETVRKSKRWRLAPGR